MDNAELEKYARIVQATDEEIAKDNRLFILRSLHRKWKEKQKSKEPEFTGEEATEKMAKKIGTCQQCGKEEVSLRSNLGKEVCSMCGIVRSQVKNNPDMVNAVLTEFHGYELVVPGDMKTAEPMEVSMAEGALADIEELLGLKNVLYSDIVNEVAKLLQREAAYKRLCTEQEELIEWNKKNQDWYHDESSDSASTSKADSRLQQLLDIALAALRRDYAVVADNLELLRRG